MAIDGRDIGKPGREKDAYDSMAPRVIAVAIVAVPVALLIGASYWIGTWTGGVLGGILGIVSTMLTVGVLWLLMRRKRH
jgi:hypothetical protein